MPRNDGRTHDSDYSISQFATTFSESANVAVTVPRDFYLTLDYAGSPFARLFVPAGTTSLPRSVANHPWSRLNGVH